MDDGKAKRYGAGYGERRNKKRRLRKRAHEIRDHRSSFDLKTWKNMIKEIIIKN